MTAGRMRKLRDRLGESQEKFGERFPVDRRTIIRWEAGDAIPSPMARKHMQTLERELTPASDTPAPVTPDSTTPRRRGVMPSSQS